MTIRRTHGTIPLLFFGAGGDGEKDMPSLWKRG